MLTANVTNEQAMFISGAYFLSPTNARITAAINETPNKSKIVIIKLPHTKMHISNPPLPPFSKGGNLISPFEKGGVRGIIFYRLCEPRLMTVHPNVRNVLNPPPL